LIIQEAKFLVSSSRAEDCPGPDKPEFAFLGRSNVGKSSFINMITGHRKLARISSTPGKTRLINHFVINGNWFLVDLPGYGYAKISKKLRNEFMKMISDYLLRRTNLVSLFLLIDSRHDPQTIDLQFIEWLGVNQVPFVLCFTKSDKLKSGKLTRQIETYKKELLKSWESLPDIFITSAIQKRGREEILEYLEKSIASFRNSH